MSSFSSHRLSRRSLLLGSIAALVTRAADSASQFDSPLVDPVDLGHGLEIHDLRMLPAEDAPRFMLELHNAGDEAIDTPSVGVSLPYIDSEKNTGWANPVSAVLYPQMSDVLVGVVPEGLTSENEWKDAEWTLCDEPTSRHSSLTNAWKVTVQTELEVRSFDHAVLWATVYNHTSERIGPFYVASVARDEDGRVCGALEQIWAASIGPSETKYLQKDIRPSATYAANPFMLHPDFEGLILTTSIQPQVYPVNSGCEILLPWHQN